MLKEAQARTEENAKKIEQSLGNVAKAAIGVFAGMGIKSFLDSSLHSWDEQEKAIIGLEAVLKSNGREVEETSKSYQAFATDMQNVTTTGDEVTVNLLKQAETFELTGASAKVATKEAMALAAINDSSAQSMIRITAAMAQGDIEKAMMFSRMIPQLRGVKDETEFVARYQKLAAAGMEVMNKEAETATGRMQQLNNDWGDFKEQLGETLSKGIAPVANALRDQAKWIQTLSGNTRTVLAATLAFAAGLVIVATLGPTVASGITTIASATKALTISMATNPVGLLVIGLVAAATAVIVYRDNLAMTSEEIAKMNNRLDATKNLWEKMNQGVRVKTTENLSDINKIGGTEAKKKALQEEIEILKDDLDMAEARFQKYTERKPNMLTRLTGGEEVRKAVADWEGQSEAVVQYKQALLNAEAALQRLNRVPKKLEGDAAITTKSLTDLERELKRLKMTQDELAVDDAKKLGLSDNEAAMVAKKQVQLDIAKAYKESTIAVEDFTKAQIFERETLGMSEGQKQLEKMRRERGAFNEQVLLAEKELALTEAATKAHEEKLQREKEATEALTKSVKDLAAAYRDAAGAGSAEAIQRGNDYLDMIKGSRTGRNVEINQRNDVPQEKIKPTLENILAALDNMAVIRLGIAGMQ